MKTFLIAIGGTLAALAIVVLVVIWWLKRKLRSFVEQIGEIAKAFGDGVPPFEITLKKVEPEWSDSVLIDTVTNEFKSLGYEPIGEYEIPEMDDMNLRAFANTEAKTTAVLYDSPTTGIWVDTVAAFEDKTSITSSHHKFVGLMNRPDWTVLHKIPFELAESTERIRELHEAVLQGHNGRTLRETNAENFADIFVSAYKREMDWRIDRGAPTPDEIRRSTDAMDDLDKPDQEQIEGVQLMWSEAIADHMDEIIQEEYLDAGTMPANEWEKLRDQLLYIHRWKHADSIVNEFQYCLLNDHDDEDEDQDDDDYNDEMEDQLDNIRPKLLAAFEGKATVLEGFEAMLELLPEKERPKKYAEHNGKHPAIIYVRPEDENFGDE